ncbi:PecM protein [Ketogulonicigenium robustum]|uniref:PecM protein n=1 Tax=Ketogulonicigenium robustum TaxID=92947 RepID=A0A1W6NZ88_9RHOB|nr:PecM protein [Ketogulonicigenium robustum]
MWGFTYILTTTMLPPNPMFLAAVRALGGGVILLFLARDVPPRAWWGKLTVLGTLNNGLFFGLLFVAAVRLPGGVAATFQALTPLFTVLLALPLLGVAPSRVKLIAVLAGAVGVSMVVLRGGAGLDAIGILAAFGSAVSLSLGGILLHKWGRPSSVVSLTAWQMLIAGVELAIVAVIMGDVPTSLSATNVLGLVILAVLLTAVPFVLWFTGIQGAGPSAIAPFMLLTPIVAFVLDALVHRVLPSPLQALGVVVVIGALLLGQFADRKPAKG